MRTNDFPTSPRVHPRPRRRSLAAALSLALAPLAALSISACEGTGSGLTGVVRSAAQLSALTLSAGVLAPVFSPTITSYSAAVNNATDQITVTPTVATPGATVTVNGAVVPSGTASPANNLIVGQNEIDVIVTNPDGLSTRTYVIQVQRSAF